MLDWTVEEAITALKSAVCRNPNFRSHQNLAAHL